MLSLPSTPVRSQSRSSPLPSLSAVVHRPPSAPTEPILTVTSTPTSLNVMQDNKKVVYRYKQSLEGIVGEYHADEPSTVVMSALGQAADEYLHAHGYLPGTIHLIQNFFEEAATKDCFVNKVARHGVPIAEAAYLHSLIVKKKV